MPIRAPEVQCYPADLLAPRELMSPEANAPDGLTSISLDKNCDAMVRSRAGDRDAGHSATAAIGEQVGASRRWWVVHTKSRQEKSVARELLGREIPFYLPQVRKTGLQRGRKTSSYIPLFAGYLFMFGNESDRYSSMKTNRVAQFLPVADEGRFVHELRDIARLIECGSPLTVEARLQAGDRVRIKSGALVGVEGTVIERRRKCRVMVAVNLIQRGVSVEIDDFLLEPLG
jgi:transcription antitermination factor NusG